MAKKKLDRTHLNHDSLDANLRQIKHGDYHGRELPKMDIKQAEAIAHPLQTEIGRLGKIIEDYEAQLASLTHENNELGAALAVEKVKVQNQAALLRQCLEVVEEAEQYAKDKLFLSPHIDANAVKLVEMTQALLPELNAAVGKEK